MYLQQICPGKSNGYVQNLNTALWNNSRYIVCINFGNYALCSIDSYLLITAGLVLRYLVLLTKLLYMMDILNICKQYVYESSWSILIHRRNVK